MTGIERQVRSANGDTRTEIIEQREYDGISQLLSRVVTEGVNPDDGASVEIDYDSSGNAITITERGYTPVLPAQAHTLDTNDLSVEAYEPIERTTQLQWQDNKLIAIDGPRTDVEDITRLQWDERNRLIGIAPPLSPALAIERFDEMGRAVQIRLGQQSPVMLEYNAAGQLLSSRQNAKVLDFGYDPEGRLIGVSDTFDRTYSMEHDEAGRLVAFTDDMGQRKNIGYDTESRRVSDQLLGIGGEQLSLLSALFDEQGNISQTQREQAGDSDAPRLTIAAHEPQQDGIGSRTTDLNSGGELIRSLDQVNRVATVTGGNGLTRRVELDAAGRFTSVSDQRGNVTRYWFDDFGRQVLQSSEDTGIQVSRFDAADNLLERQIGDGTTIRYQHDAANRQTERFDGVATTTLSWDAENGKLLEASNADTTERFTYDTELRLTEHVRQIDGYQFRTAYRYDELGRLTDKDLPDGQRLSYWYHEEGVNRGSLRAITTGGMFGLGQQTIVAEIDLERRDGSSGYTAGNGVRSNMTYAPDGQVKSIDIGGQLALDYGFDERGRIIRIDDNGQHQSYQWQGNRLSQASTVLGNYSYQYDAVDNRTARTVTERDGRTSSEWYDYPLAGSGNRLLSSEDDAIAQATVYEYNGAGSTTERGDLSFTYDAHQRPVQVRRFDRLIAEYVYNPFGERVKKTVYEAQGPPTITYFLFDGSSLSAQVDGEGELIDQYVYLEDYRPIARLSGGDIQAIHTDHLGAPRLVTDSEAKVIWQARYSPFGAATLEIAQIDLPHRLPGQQLDAETGLHYNYFRHYDPSTGSYTTSDPLGLVAGYNTYGYVGANPLSVIDPRGLIGFPLIGGVSGLLSLSRGVIFLDTAGATGALARFVAGVVAVGASPVVVGGTVLAVAALAVYYATHNNNNEEAFVQQMGGAKPETEDFSVLRDQMERLDDEFHKQFDWDSFDTWGEFFWVQSRLLDLQRTYIAQCDAGGPIDIALYNEAKEAIDAAAKAASAAAATQVQSFSGELHLNGQPTGIEVDATGFDANGNPTGFGPATQEAAEQLESLTGTPIDVGEPLGVIVINDNVEAAEVLVMNAQGHLPLDKGGEQWGRRNGVGAAEGRRRAHKIKQDDNMSGATDVYTVDPDTGDVFDPEGEYVGNLEDDY